MTNVTSEVGDMIRDGMSMEASRGITEEQSKSSSNLVSVIKSTPTNSSEISTPHCNLSDSDGGGGGGGGGRGYRRTLMAVF